MRGPSSSAEAFERFGDGDSTRNSGDIGTSAPAPVDPNRAYLDASPPLSGLIEPSSALKNEHRAGNDQTPTRERTGRFDCAQFNHH